MNKAELAAVIAGKTGQTKKAAEHMIDAVIEAIAEELAQHGKVQLMGFGSFESKRRAARMGNNPRTGEPVPVPEMTAVVFRAAKALKETVNKNE